jgi:hypothetical protein
VQVTSFGYTAFEADVQIQAGGANDLTTTLVREGAATGGAAITMPGLGVGLFAGGGGGVNARGGGGGLGFGVLGVRYGVNEVVTELGGSSAGLTGALVYRYSVNLGSERAVAFFGIGYAYSPAASYELEAGLRVALARGDHARVDLRASARLQFVPASDGSDSTTAVPILVSLEAATR